MSTFTNMNKQTAKLLYGVVIAEAVIGLVLGFLAYFVRSFDKATGTYFDGLGRHLDLAPFFIRFVFWNDSLWAGWNYFALDMVVFWSGIGIGSAILGLASKFETKKGT